MVAPYSYGITPVEGFISLSLYGILLLVVLARIGMLFTVQPAPAILRLPKLFHTFLLCFLCCRLLTVVLDNFYDLPGLDWAFQFVMNRLTSLAFLSSFSVMLHNWATVFHASNNHMGNEARHAYSRKVGRGLALLNVIYYVYELAVIIILTPNDGRKQTALYQVDMLIYVFIFVLLAILFLIYGVRIALKVRKIEIDNRQSSINTQNRDPMMKGGRWMLVLFASLIFCFAFLARCFVFSYHLMFQTYLPHATFDILGYLIPELLPSWFQIGLMWGVELRVDAELDESFLEYEQYIDRDEDGGEGGGVGDGDGGGFSVGSAAAPFLIDNDSYSYNQAHSIASSVNSKKGPSSLPC